MATLAQRSFAAGELTPALHSRCDIVKYLTGVKTLRNFFVLRHGGAASRPGTTFVGEAKDSTRKVRLIPCAFDDGQEYVLEFGHRYIRVIKDGEHVREAATTITSISQAAQGVVSITAHGYSDGDDVVLSGIVGMTELNGRRVRVSDATADMFKIKDQAGNYIDTSGYTAYVSGGTAERVYTIDSGALSAGPGVPLSPYQEDDLFELQFVLK